MSRSLRVGVIGTGAFAEACHIPGILSHPAAEVVMLCGRREPWTRTLAQRFGIPRITLDPAEICASSDVDAITICTANAAHHPQVMLALKNRKHVFCEKPLALSVAQSREMTRAAEASGLVNQVAFTFRHLFGIGELRRRVADGDIGDPLFVRIHHEYRDNKRFDTTVVNGWRYRSRATGGGVLLDTGAHLFDLAHLVAGPVTAVKAALCSVVEPDAGGDDIASVAFRCASGTAGHLFASRTSEPQVPNAIQVTGSTGTLLAYISRGGFDALRRRAPGQASWEEVALPGRASDGHPHALTLMMRSFVDSCLQGRLVEGAASFRDGLAVQETIAAAGSGTEMGWTDLQPAP